MAVNPSAAIDIENVQFSWRGSEPLLDIKRFLIHPGECVFLRGASGSGKSTLLGLIGGVLTPTQGAIRILGTNIATAGSAARDRFRGEHLGFIFQMFNLVPYLSAVENVLLPARFSPARRAKLGTSPRTEALRLLEALGLSTRELNRQITQLSIGQQQRVAAARALLGRPAIVIADEPTSALDEDTRTTFMTLLLDQCRALGTTVLFASHDITLQSRFDRGLSMADLNKISEAR